MRQLEGVLERPLPNPTSQAALFFPHPPGDGPSPRLEEEMEVAPWAACEDAGLWPPALPRPRPSLQLPLVPVLLAAPAARGHQGASDIRPRGSAKGAGSSESDFRLLRHQPSSLLWGRVAAILPPPLGTRQAWGPSKQAIQGNLMSPIPGESQQGHASPPSQRGTHRFLPGLATFRKLSPCPSS